MNYLNTYEGVEKLEDFSIPQLVEYRKMLLRKTAHQTDFIRRRCGFTRSNMGHVLEIGSGNGRLLIDLASRGLTARSRGIEISKSRVEFARSWATALQKLPGWYWSAPQFDENDVLKLATDPVWLEKFDLAVCITGCFQYFRPISIDAPSKVLNFMRKSASMALFELYKPPVLGRTWYELPKEDRFRFSLDTYEEVHCGVKHSKIFIGRDGGIDEGRVEYLYYYSMGQFLSLLQKHGFKNLLWAKQDDTRMVILVQ